MKKIKIVAMISGVLTGLQLIPTTLSTIMWAGYEIKSASAIGIIGAADGPTSIIVAGIVNPVLFILARGFLLLCAVTFIVSTVLYVRKRKQSSHD